jgi:hypothetical protein
MRVLLELQSKRLGFIGLAFNENTDDLRESGLVSLLESLIGRAEAFESSTRIAGNSPYRTNDGQQNRGYASMGRPLGSNSEPKARSLRQSAGLWPSHSGSCRLFTNYLRASSLVNA